MQATNTAELTALQAANASPCDLHTLALKLAMVQRNRDLTPIAVHPFMHRRAPTSASALRKLDTTGTVMVWTFSFCIMFCMFVYISTATRHTLARRAQIQYYPIN